MNGLIPAKGRKGKQAHEQAGLRRVLAALICCSALGFLFQTVPVSAGEAEAEARRATRLYEAGDYAAAAAAFEKAQQLAQERGEAPPAFDYNLGTVYARKGELDKAIETLEAAAEAAPADEAIRLKENAQYNLGVTRERRTGKLKEGGTLSPQEEYGQLGEALRAFREALILDPADADARHNYAVTQRKMKAAEEEIRKQQAQSSRQQPQQGSGKSGEPQEQQQPGAAATPPPSGTQGDSQPQQQSTPGSPQSSPPTDGTPPPAADEPKPEGSAQDAEAKPTPSPSGTPGKPEDSGAAEQPQPGADSRDGRGGLEAEATPTPAPGKKPTADPGPQATPSSAPGPGPTPGSTGAAQGGKSGEAASEKGQNGQPPPGGAGGEANEPELTPEQLDALRVLNSLEEDHPEQFRRVFRFPGSQSGKLERDW